MLRKKNKRLKESRSTSKPYRPLSQEAKEALEEMNLFDDHGPVVLGNRKDKPKF